MRLEWHLDDRKTAIYQWRSESPGEYVIKRGPQGYVFLASCQEDPTELCIGVYFDWPRSVAFSN